MKLSRETIAIILAFITAGSVMTTVDAEAYQTVYKEHDRQEQKIKKVLASEFVSAEQQKQLKKDLKAIEQAEKKETRHSLRSRLAEEKVLIAKIQKSAAAKEAQTAQTELAKLTDAVTALEKKKAEAFIDADDFKEVENVSAKYKQLTAAKQVAPVRTFTYQVKGLTSRIDKNQAKLVAVVNELKEANKSAAELAEKKYLSEKDKATLTAEQKKNEQFFADADSYQTVQQRRDTSKSLLKDLASKHEKIEKEFSENEKPATELIESTKALLASSDVSAEEKEQLTKASQALTDTLQLKEIEPGQLNTHYQALQTNYTDISASSERRAAEAKKKAEQEAAAAAAAAAQAEKQNNATAQASAAAPTQVGGWYQAPAGYKFLKPDSGKTYGQVKNPGNYQLITAAEAANYSPGHGNGSAKQ